MSCVQTAFSDVPPVGGALSGWFRALVGGWVIGLAGCSPAPDSAVGQATVPAPVLASSAPVGAPSEKSEEKVLNFSNWFDYMPEGLLEGFERETGIKVNYRTYGSNEDLQKLVALKAESDDLVVPSLSYGKTQASRGYYQPLNKSLLPSLGNMNPALMKSIAVSDPGNTYFLPWAWGYTTLFVNKTRVRKALGDLAYPDNELELVFNPIYTARLKSCGIAYLDSPSEIVPLAMHYLGIDPYSADVAVYNQAIDMLKLVRNDINVFSDKMLDVFSEDKTCVGIAWSGDVNSAIAELKDGGSTDELVGAQPTVGSLMFVDVLAIPVNAKHPRNAHAFIEFYLRATNAARMPTEIGYPNGNDAALAFVPAQLKDNTLVFPPPAFFAKLVPSSGYSDQARWAMMQGYVSFAFRLDTRK